MVRRKYILEEKLLGCNMKKIFKVLTVSAVLLLVLPFVFSCQSAPENMVPQEEYDSLKAQLNTAEARIAELELNQEDVETALRVKVLEEENTSLKAEIDDLNNEVAALGLQNDTLAQEKSALEAQYADLNARYDELEAAFIDQGQPEVITEEKVEDEIFRLLNQARVAAGLPEFQLGKQLYGQAKQNSRAMAASGKFESNPAVFYQEVFWAAGYDNIDAIARGAMLTWQANEYRFEHGALLISNKYGAVGAYQSGEIIYITFMAAAFP